MQDWQIASICTLGFLLVLCIGRRALGSRAPYPLPPGPLGLPWIGSIIGVDPEAPWLTCAEWARTYGDLVYSRLLGKDIIIINSERVAKDLLEKRSRNYSDRPYLISQNLCGLYFTALLPYGDRWRVHRRLFHQTFRPEVVHRFLPYQQHKASHLLHRLLDAPEGLKDHVYEYTTSTILNGTYQYDPSSLKDDLIDMMANVSSIILPVLRPDINFIVEVFPWLLHLPSWLPGMSFKKKMTAARTFVNKYFERPFEYSIQKVLSGTIAPSMVHDALWQMEEKGIASDVSRMQELKEAAGTAFLAGSENSGSVLMTFFLMMTLNPAVQERVQAQIDAVVGKDRLPTIDDRLSLPWVDAIFWETLRYSPVVPLSVPHTAVDDDVYGGFRIPKGAILLANVWSMAHDKSRFPNPHAFVPERFLNEDGSLKPNEMEHITFGFGRRICIGKHFAEMSIWVVIARVLSVFKISKALDENGVEIPVEPKFLNGLAIQPLPFKCKIVPRFPGMDGEKLEQLIAASTA